MNAFAESGRSYYHRPSVRPLQLVVNPVSGNGRGVAVARGLERRLRAEGYDARTRVFQDSAEARVWVEDTRERLDCLICVGGDSTLSEFAPVAVRLGARFLPVPTGFGNIFARAFGHRADPDFVLRLLRGGRVLHADVGQEDKGGGLFLSSRSFGLNSEANLNVLDAGFAAEQKRVFDEDVAKSKRITYSAWQKRPLLGRIEEVFITPLIPQL